MVQTRVNFSIISSLLLSFFLSIAPIYAQTDLEITKRNSPTGVVTPGQTITYRINVENTGSDVIENVTISDPLPNGSLYVANSATVTYPASFADDFATATYSDNDGSSSFLGPWIEEGDDGSANRGDVRLGTIDGLRGIRFSESDDSIRRSVNLANSASVTLSLGFNRQRLDDADDKMIIQIFNDATSSYDTLGEIVGPTDDTSWQAVSYNIPASYLDSNTEFRFLADGIDRNDRIYINDVKITGIFTEDSNGPSDLTSGLTHNIDLESGQAAVANFQVTVDPSISTSITSVSYTHLTLPTTPYV